MYIHTYPHTYTYLFTDFDECANGIGCYRIYLFPFGDENGDVLRYDDYPLSIELNSGFVFHSTNYTTVFVSLKPIFSVN